jgi:hypothetical protein
MVDMDTSLTTTLCLQHSLQFLDTNATRMSTWDRKKKGNNRLEHDNDSPIEGSDSESDVEVKEPISISARICLWEFGQNDPKR